MGMKQILVMMAAVVLLGCGPAISDPIIEKAIREELKKPTGKLTKADLEKVTELVLHGNNLTSVECLKNCTELKGLYLNGNKLTSVKGLEKLKNLYKLSLYDNPDLTKAQIDELKKALPNCTIYSDHGLASE
jgi:hypothetical protein